MEFKEFKTLLQSHVSEMLESQNALFVTDVDKDELWEIYLNSFPSGTNEIFRERREFDCSCCRHFVKSFGNVVVIQDNKIITIWDFKTNDDKFQPVIKKLAKYTKSKPIKDVFVTKENTFGTDYNHELFDNKTPHKWDHFFIKLPKEIVRRSPKTVPTIVGEYRDIRNVFQRSLEEITEDAIETVLDIIAQKSLYKGEEWGNILNKFLTIHKEYHKLPDKKKDIYCWSKSIDVGGVIGKIRNHSIGVLLIDISNEVELDIAVKKYETIVAPTNYKRPKAIFTKKMIEEAQDTITKLGFLDSLERRFATIDDIKINNILYANKDSARRMSENVFSELQQDAITNPKKFKRVKEIDIKDFINNVLPRTTSIKLFFENRHYSNLVSLIAPSIKNSQSMFKWNNGFSWAYNGNITDSMKQRVKSAGGNVEGVLRFSIQWNENQDNQNDFDAHCIEPNGSHIYYPEKGRRFPSTGMLDVDIIHPDLDQVAVENITWTSIDKMQEGIYHFFVNNYTHRGSRKGFKAQIEYDGQIYEYEYNKELRNNENVTVAKLRFNRQTGIEFIESLESSLSSRNIWGLNTNDFHPVSVLMYSPNYWDDQNGIGNRHYFFMLNSCKNENRPNGFFNEFLREDLMKHKRVFEALGGKMKVESSNDQLSGVGFSSTKRNYVICQIEGHIKRMVKITF